MILSYDLLLITVALLRSFTRYGLYNFRCFAKKKKKRNNKLSDDSNIDCMNLPRPEFIIYETVILIFFISFKDLLVLFISFVYKRGKKNKKRKINERALTFFHFAL